MSNLNNLSTSGSKVMLNKLIDEFDRRNDLPKSDDDHMVNDDTQIGIEFAFEQLGAVPEGMQLVSEKAISYLFDNHREAYDEFYKLITDNDNEVLEIKNCPYCKKPPAKFSASVAASQCSFDAIVIECSNDDDDSTLPFIEHQLSVYGIDEKQAIKEWNKAVSKNYLHLSK